MDANELVSKWRHVIDQTEHIWSWTETTSLAYWAEQASHASKIIEVGTHFGKSAKVMLLANPDAKMWCIDGFHQTGTEHTARHFLREEIQSGRCKVINFTFNNQDRSLWPQIEDLRGTVDLILLDNGHEYSEVKEQILCLTSFLKSGGVLCGHDLDRNPDNGVTRAVKELLPDFTEPVPRVWSKVMA